MTLAAYGQEPTKTELKRALQAPRRLGNSSNSNRFAENSRDFEPATEKQLRGARDPGLCQNETVHVEPGWNGAVLVPEFAAQVLGQVMMGGELQSRNSAFRSYRGAALCRPSVTRLDVDI